MNHKKTFDAIVIGGGPAGATASTVLAQHGRSVLVLEKEKFPRYHIGESLIPHCYFPLKRLGMIDKLNREGFTRKHSVQFVATDGKLSQPFYFTDHRDHESSVTWQVDRARFDQMLLDNAREKGVHVLEETRVKNLLTEDQKVAGVTAIGKDGETVFRAPMVIDCSGRDGLVIKRNGWRVPEQGMNKTAVWGYFKGAKRAPGIDEGATTIAYLPAKGWFWHIALANDIVSVGAVAEKDYLFSETRDLETILNREIQKNPWIADMVQGGVSCGGYHATGDYSYRSRYIARDGVVLAGDAFSFLDPVFSSGVFLALVSGELVADAVEDCLKAGDFSAHRFEDYAKQYRYAIEAMRKIVYAFYDLDFNFKTFVKKNPDFHGDLTDCLIGNVFKDLEPLFQAIGDFVRLPDALAHGLPHEAVVPAL